MKAYNILAGFLLAGVLSFAQAPSPEAGQPAQSAGQESQPTTAAPQHYEFTGCLTRAATDYIVVADDGHTYKLNTADNGRDLEQYVGKKLSVSADDNRSPNISTGIANTPAQIGVEVQGVRQIDGDCENQGANTRTAEASQPVETPTGTEPSNAGSIAAGAEQPAPTSSSSMNAEASQSATEAERSAESATRSAGRGVERAGEATGNAAESAASTVGRGAERAGEAVAGAAQSAGNAVERKAEEAGIADRDADAAAAPDSNTMAQARQPESLESADQDMALPQTASPLPLIALLGLGSIASGIVARRRRK